MEELLLSAALFFRPFEALISDIRLLSRRLSAHFSISWLLIVRERALRILGEAILVEAGAEETVEEGSAGGGVEVRKVFDSVRSILLFVFCFFVASKSNFFCILSLRLDDDDVIEAVSDKTREFPNSSSRPAPSGDAGSEEGLLYLYSTLSKVGM